MNSSQLEAFYSVAKLLNFTKAAETLHITQSALSQRIAKLEEDLETTLFIRDRTSIRLTESGEKVLRFCQLNTNAEADLLENLKGSAEGLAGVIRVGGFSSINRSLVIPSLKKILSQNPRLSVQIMTKELAELGQLLRSGEADYIFTDRKSESQDIHSMLLGYEENVLVKLKKAADSETYLDHDANDLTTRSYFSHNKMSFKPTAMRYLDDVYGLIDGVKHGFGKAILPLHLIENEAALEVIEPKKVLKVPVYLQYFVQPFYGQSHEPFIKSVELFFKQRLRQ